MNVHRPAALLVFAALCVVAAASTAPVRASPPLDLPTLLTTAVSSPPVAGTPGWTNSCIYCPKRFDESGEHYMAIDDAGRVHIAYGGDALYYAVQEGAVWQIETVDPSPGVGSGATLALDAAGQPMIGYFDSNTTDLKFAHKVDGNWQIETIESGCDTDMAPSLAADAAGRPHVAYISYVYNSPSDRREQIVYAYRDTAGWHRSVVDTWGEWQAFSLAVSREGIPHVAYTVWGGPIHYTYRDPSGWQSTPPIDVPDGLRVETLALALDATGHPRLMFATDFPTLAPTSLYYVDWSGSGWVTELVDKGRRIRAVSLLTDEAGRPHFVGHSLDYYYNYYDYSEGFAWYGWRDATGWHFDAIQVEALHPDLAFGPDATLHAAFFNDNTALELSQPGPAGGWRREAIVDREDHLAMTAALALDRQGVPQAVFTGNRTYHARLAEYGWQTETMFEPATPVAMAIDSPGRPHVILSRWWAPPLSEIGPCCHALLYARPEAGAWHAFTITDRGGGSPHLAIDNANRAHLAYVQGAHPDDPERRDEFRYLLEGRQTVLDVSTYMGETALAVDPDGNPHIVAHGEYYMFSHLFSDGSAWHREAVGTWPYIAFSMALVIDPEGQPAIAYGGEAGDDEGLLFAERGPDGWQVQQVADDHVPSDFYVPIPPVYDACGAPHIIFWLGGVLQHAWRVAGSWQVNVVPPGASSWSEARTSLALDPAGGLFAVYVDAVANDVRLAELRLDGFGPEPNSLFLPVIVR